MLLDFYFKLSVVQTPIVRDLQMWSWVKKPISHGTNESFWFHCDFLYTNDL